VRLNTCSTIAAGSPRGRHALDEPLRLQACEPAQRERVTCSSPPTGLARPRGRDLAAGAPAAWRTSASSTSSLEGSSQCRSSTTSRTGLRAGGQHQLQQSFERLLLPLLRRELERRARASSVAATAHPPAGHGFAWLRRARARSSRSLLVRRVRLVEPREPGQHLDHGVERAWLVW
jgi:hypothetical protein